MVHGKKPVLLLAFFYSKDELSKEASWNLSRYGNVLPWRGGGLPEWSKYSTGNGEVMVLDDVSELKNDPDREARKAFPKL